MVSLKKHLIQSLTDKSTELRLQLTHIYITYGRKLNTNDTIV